VSVVTDACLLNVLRVMRAQLAGLTLRLIQAPWIPGPQTAWADVMECDFPGYVPAKLVGWGPVYMDMSGLDAETDLPIYRFTQGGAPTPLQTVYGWVITDSAFRVWVSSLLDAPVLLSHVPQVVSVQPYVTLTRAR
jgi:hypothetical protein